jgi:hypothetical protein
MMHTRDQPRGIRAGLNSTLCRRGPATRRIELGLLPSTRRFAGISWRLLASSHLRIALKPQTLYRNVATFV